MRTGFAPIIRLIAAAGLLLPGTAAARQPITLQEAIELSYRQNPALEAARRASEAATFSKKSAWGLHLPRLGVTGAYTYLDRDIDAFDFNPQKEQLLRYLGENPLPFPLPAETLGTLQGLDLKWTLQEQQFAVVGAAVAWPFYMGGKINAAVNAEKIGIQQRRAEAQKTKTDLFAEVVERYYGLALARNILSVRRQASEGMRTHLADAQKMEQNGMIARTETLYAQMYLARAEGEQQAAALQATTADRALGTSMGTSMGMSMGEAGEEAEGEGYIPLTALFVVDSLPPLDYYQEQIRAYSPMLKQVELARRLAREGVRAARSSLLPELAAVGTYAIWNHNLTSMAPKWAVGATASLRIFDGLQSEHKHTAAKRKVLQIEALQSKAENDLMLLVTELYHEILGQSAAVRALGATVQFAAAHLEAKRKAFGEGIASSSEVVDARLGLAAAQAERLAAAYAFDVALARLLALAGETDRLGDFAYQPDYQLITND